MTALDQAFIKAYTQKEGASADPPDSAKPILSSGPDAERSSSEAIVAPPADVPAAMVSEELLDVLEEPVATNEDEPSRSNAPAEVNQAAPPETPKIDEEQAAQSGIPAFLKTGTSLAAAGEQEASMRQSFETLGIPHPEPRANPVHRIDPAPVVDSASASEESAVPAPHLAKTSTDRPCDTEQPKQVEDSDTESAVDAEILSFKEAAAAPDTEQSPAEETSAEQASVKDVAARSFLPMLQVERYTIPKTCMRLDQAAGSALDHLTDGITEAMNRRQRVVAIGACRHGEGATTMLLCAAQRLVRRGLKVAIVDGQLEEPRLAKQLGMAPEFGWEDVLAGRMPLEDVVIEAIDSGLVVLPCCRPIASVRRTPEIESRMIESLRTLRENYDLVLIDIDPLDDRTLETGDSISRAIVERIEAVTLVHDASTTSPHHLGDVQRRLATNGIASAGIVENFVPN